MFVVRSHYVHAVIIGVELFQAHIVTKKTQHGIFKKIRGIGTTLKVGRALCSNSRIKSKMVGCPHVRLLIAIDQENL